MSSRKFDVSLFRLFVTFNILSSTTWTLTTSGMKTHQRKRSELSVPFPIRRADYAGPLLDSHYPALPTDQDVVVSSSESKNRHVTDVSAGRESNETELVTAGSRNRNNVGDVDVEGRGTRLDAAGGFLAKLFSTFVKGIGGGGIGMGKFPFGCACDMRYEPVCGTDGMTYPNRCYLGCRRMNGGGGLAGLKGKNLKIEKNDPSLFFLFLSLSIAESSAKI
jgi:hypothetical protein